MDYHTVPETILDIDANSALASLLYQSSKIYDIIASHYEEGSVVIQLNVLRGVLPRDCILDACTKIMRRLLPRKEVMELKLSLASNTALKMEWQSKICSDGLKFLNEWYIRCFDEQVKHRGSIQVIQELYNLILKLRPVPLLPRPVAKEPNDQDGDVCIICIVRPPCYAIKPCKHAVYCQLCIETARTLTRCGLCRAPITKVYMP